MPQSFDYVLLGGGTSCGYAAAAIREIDKQLTIGIISADKEPPYDRPPFSKNFLTNDAMEVSDAHSKDDSFYSDNDIVLMLDTEAYAIKAGPRAVELRSGELINYGKLLYAMGSEPRVPNFPGADRVMTLRTAADSARIKEAAKNAKSALIIGGGYIGAEVAASLLARGVRVTLVEMADKVYNSIFSKAASEAVQKELQKMGAEVYTNDSVAEITGSGPYSAKTKSGKSIEADIVIAGIGAAPRIRLAKEAELAIGDSGILANASLGTSDPNIWVAGDVAEYPDVVVGRNFRAEHHLHAKWTGQHAGKVMAGEAQEYRKAPYFFSDVGELSLILRGDPEPSGKHIVVGDTDAPQFTEIVLREDGTVATMLDLRRDFKVQDPINDLYEKLIEERKPLGDAARELEKSGDPMIAQSVLG